MTGHVHGIFVVETEVILTCFRFAANADFTKKNNPYVYFFPFPSIVSVAAFNFYSAFFSNGTYGAGGVAK